MRRCLFCPNRASSVEHAWPVWLMESVGPVVDVKRVELTGTIQAWFGGRPVDSAPQTWSGPNASLTVRHVCKKCNEGWMSRLESSVKPFMSPLINDLSFPLSRDQQTALALWMMKTAMVLEATNKPSRRFFTDDERAELFRSGKLPVGSQIWIGRSTPHISSYSEARRLGGATTRSGVESPLSDGYANTFVFGRLVLHALNFHLKPTARVWPRTVDVKPGPVQWDDLLAPIWPVRRENVSWPPAYSFSEQAFDELNQRYTVPHRVAANA
jgi:hypothetical protein